MPLVNYGIGLALASDNVDMVILVRDGSGPLKMPTAVMLKRAADDPHGFDTVAHNLNATYGKDGSLRSLGFSKIGAP